MVVCHCDTVATLPWFIQPFAKCNNLQLNRNIKPFNICQADSVCFCNKSCGINLQNEFAKLCIGNIMQILCFCTTCSLECLSYWGIKRQNMLYFTQSLMRYFTVCIRVASARGRLLLQASEQLERQHTDVECFKCPHQGWICVL